jgi:hypothetical protein
MRVYRSDCGEAMGNMKPFANFLLLVGKVAVYSETCPD